MAVSVIPPAPVGLHFAFGQFLNCSTTGVGREVASQQPSIRKAAAQQTEPLPSGNCTVVRGIVLCWAGKLQQQSRGNPALRRE